MRGRSAYPEAGCGEVGCEDAAQVHLIIPPLRHIREEALAAVEALGGVQGVPGGGGDGGHLGDHVGREWGMGVGKPVVEWSTGGVPCWLCLMVSTPKSIEKEGVMGR